uniref:PPM-type phosphatase domain-containing protein n=1 Tax=Craspedostauros australis TaxID=1486917 RepID=A0A7R9ZMV8_9STRA
MQLGAATVAGDTAAETNYPEAIDQDEPHLVNEEGSDEQQSADDKPAAASNNDDGADSADGINVIPMSFDHKPDKEAERIENAGLKVQESRFIDENEKELVFHKIIRSNGDQLAVSRAFGDFEYKTNKTLGPEEQAVIAVPDVKIHPRNVQVDLYLVLACDGIWDVMSNVEVGKYVSQEMDAIKTQPRRIDSTVLPQVGDALLSTCLDKGSRDNMSVVLVALNQGAEPLAPISESSGGDDDAVKTLSFA